MLKRDAYGSRLVWAMREWQVVEVSPMEWAWYYRFRSMASVWVLKLYGGPDWLPWIVH